MYYYYYFALTASHCCCRSNSLSPPVIKLAETQLNIDIFKKAISNKTASDYSYFFNIYDEFLKKLRYRMRIQQFSILLISHSVPDYVLLLRYNVIAMSYHKYLYIKPVCEQHLVLSLSLSMSTFAHIAPPHVHALFFRFPPGTHIPARHTVCLLC